MNETRSNIRRMDWRGLLLILGMALIGVVSFQGSRGIYETTEGRYSECARETMATGDYDDPVLNGQLHWTKPPLTYLSIMAGLRVFGLNPWGARAYLMVALILAAGAVWLTGFSIWGAGAGRWAGVVFITSPVILTGVAQVVSADMLTVLWVAGALAGFWHGYARRSPVALLAMWVCLGLGLLTKGPPAMLVPAVSLPIAWWLLRRDADTWRPPRWTLWAGFALFVAVGLGWYVVEAEQTRGLISYWIGDELVGRNLRDEFHRNPGFGFVLGVYLPILLLGSGVWLPLVLFRGRPLKSWWPAGATDSGWNRAACGALAGGVAIPFAVFAISTSKLPLYLAPLFVPLALILGRRVELLISQGRLRASTARICAGVALGLLVAAKAGMAFVEKPKDMTRLAAALGPVLARDGAPALYTATGRYQNGLEFQLDRRIEFIQPEDLYRHLVERRQAGEDPRYVMTRRNWERYAPRFPGSGWRQESLGRDWLYIRYEPAGVPPEIPAPPEPVVPE